MLSSFTFNDFLIVPSSYSEVKSRTQVDTSVSFGDLHLKIPVISASMSVFDTSHPFYGLDKTIPDFAIAIAEAGGMHIFSRSTSFESRLNAVNHVSSLGLNVGLAVGLDEFHEHRKTLEKLDAVVSIDIANGAIIDGIHWDSSFPLIVGNFANPSASMEERFTGNIILKMGIGGGSACSTRLVTGVGYPQAGLMHETSKNSNFPLISDGGISSVSDFVKAISLGSDLVMTGKLFGHVVETPWPIEEINGREYKNYRGMASREEKKTKKFVEGSSGYLPFENKSVVEVMYDLSDGLKSAMSYVNAFNLQEFKKNVDFVYSPSHMNESSVRLVSDD